MITLHHVPRSRSVRVYWLLEELGIPYEVKIALGAPGAPKDPEYLKLNPLGKVPTIEDGDVVMFESGAIVEYLIEKYGNGRLAPAPGTPARAKFLQWVHFGEATMAPPLADIVVNTIFKPEAERLPAVVEDGKRRLDLAIGVLDKELAGKEYLLGKEFGGADIMVGYALFLTNLLGLASDKYANVAAYYARLQQRPALQKALG